MKVLAIILVATALVEGKGSGPYLPSGWRPDGPAFFLPSEVVKPSPTAEIDANLQGSEASGSDFLREYGPPKVQEISQNLLNQGLPDVTIEQTFGFTSQDAALGQAAIEKVVQVFEVKPEAISTEAPTTASQISLDDNPPISAKLPILDFVVQETATLPNTEQATESISQTNQQVSQESNAQSNQLNAQEAINTQSNQQTTQASLQYITEQTNQLNTETQTTESQSTTVQSNQQNTDSQVAEINNAQSNQQNAQESATVSTNQQESIQSLESQQESSTVRDLEKFTDSIGNTEVLLVNAPAVYDQNVPELQNIPDIIASLEKEILSEQAGIKHAVSDVSSVQVPEGLLEYGPPGFAEYGPPKEEQEKSENLQAIETNETRRRRFSPRIRFGKK